MSTYNFQELTDTNLVNKTEDVFIKMSNCYLSKKKLGIGSGYNEMDFLIMDSLYDLLCNGKCTLNCEGNKIKEILQSITLKY